MGEEEETVQLNIQVEDISDSENGSDTGDLSQQEEVKGNLETEEKTVVEPQAEEKEVKEDEQIEGSGYVKSQDETDGQEKLLKLTEMLACSGLWFLQMFHTAFIKSLCTVDNFCSSFD